jgi:hypothetical protein
MDARDKAELYGEWQKFDSRLLDLYEKEAYKFMPKIEKLIKERIGWRKRSPENDYQRFAMFMDYVEKVYLKPSLNLDQDAGDCFVDSDYSWSDEDEDEK